MSLTTRSAGAFEYFGFIFVPYSHYDETKILPYSMTLICLSITDGEQWTLSRYHRKPLGRVQQTLTLMS